MSCKKKMIEETSLVEIKISSQELERKLLQICRDGYVLSGEKWYRGFGSTGKKPNCHFCDHPGCDTI